MKYKNGVIVGIKKVVDDEIERVVVSPIIERAITIVDAVSVAMTGKEIVVPSILDGVHGEKSLHYNGLAFDMRTFIYKSQDEIEKLMAMFRYMLGPNYDVVLEKDHIHIEYDPKPKNLYNDADKALLTSKPK